MSSDPQADAFLRSYLRQPNDITARLVFADWLDETGKPHNEAWARYIRAKVEAAKHADGTAERKAAERIACAAAPDIVARLTVPAALFVGYPASLLRLLPPPNLAVTLADFVIAQAVVELMPESVARENLVLPLQLQGRTLLVAAYPHNGDTIDKLDFILNMAILAVGCTENHMREALDRHYGNTETESVDSVFYEFPGSAEPDPPPFVPADSDTPVARLLTLILAEAVNAGADRVLFISTADHIAVRHRTHNGWTDRDCIPLRLLQPLAERTARLCGWYSFPSGGHIGGSLRLHHTGFVFVIPVQIATGEFGVGMQFDIPHRFELPDVVDL